MPFKVIQGNRCGANRKPATYLVYRFEVIADYCSNVGHFAFLSHHLGGGATYTAHLRLIGKLFVLIELFSLGVTAEAL